MSVHTGSLVERLKARSTKAGVIGLGYVGLPLAIEFAKAGLTVVGVDLDTRKVDALSKGESYIGDVAATDVAAMVKAGRFRATTDFSVLSDVDTINICVPTPLRKTKDPDLSYIVASVEEIAKYFKAGQLIILESTTYPGTTDEVVQPMLEAKGLKAGVDFFLGFSPERVDPGNPQFHTGNIPKVVGGVNEASSDAAAALYGLVVKEVVKVSQHPRRRARQAAREHLPRRQHRPRQRARADVPRHGHQRVGSDRRGQDQAVRLHAVLPGPRPGRALHPDRSVLSELEGAAVRLREPLHRARRPHQRRHAALRRRPRQSRRSTRSPSRSRARRCTCSGWPTSPT